MSVVDIAKPAPADGAAPAEAEKKGGKKKLVIVVLLLAVLGGAGYWFFLKPSGPEKPQPGVVVKLDAIQVNLTGGHYLRVGIALQATTKAGEELDGSKALDATIDTFSGRSMAELARPQAREKLKTALENRLEKLYEGDVMGVYFTDFVTQ
jgi:flagellar FliL protein